MAESRAGRKKRALLSAVAVAAGFGVALLSARAPAQTAPGAAADLYGKWWSVCDNINDCMAMGTGGEGTAVTLMIRRGPEARAPARITLITDPAQLPQGKQTWRLMIDGRFAATVSARAEGRSMQAETTLIDGEALAARLAAGSVLQVQGPGADTSLSLVAAEGVLRNLDDAQGRSGGVTALVAKGRAPASAVPIPPELPVITASAISPQNDLPTNAPNGFVREQAQCRGLLRTFRKAEGFKVYRLAPNALVWFIPCGRRADADYSMVWVTNDKGDRARRALPADPDIEGLPDSVRDAIRFDADVGVLSDGNFRRGGGDCGRVTEWVWTGEAFARIRERKMAQCVGVPLAQWPVTWRAAVKRPG